ASTRFTCTLHCAPFEFSGLVEHFAVIVIMKTTAARPNSEIPLLVFIRDLRFALFSGFTIALAHTRAFGDKLIFESFALAFVQLEERSVHCAICVDIFQRNGVVLLVGEEANGPSASERSCGLTQSHRLTADLLVLFTERDILDRGYRYLHSWLSVFLKLQCVALN